MRRRILENISGTEENTGNMEYELVGSAEITVETDVVMIPLKKECTDLLLLCEKMKADKGAQLQIGLDKNYSWKYFAGLNSDLNETKEQNAIINLKKIATRLWIREGNNHESYPLSTSGTLVYKNVAEIDIKAANEIYVFAASALLTSGKIRIYGR